MRFPKFLGLFILLTVLSMACKAALPPASLPTLSAAEPTKTDLPAKTPHSTVTPILPSLAPAPKGPNEPVIITGEIPYTSPFFLNSISQPFVMLEDEAGFVRRDKQFHFSLPSQVLGPVEISGNKKLSYSLVLPAVPQATLVDVDQNGKTDTGIQVFAIAYWSNTWGDPFLEERDGQGWSTAYVSTIASSDEESEIIGGVLLIWSPDDQQSFPSDFGADGKLFTEDDPIVSVPAGYNLVDLNTKPFRIYKEAQPHIILNEGSLAVNDFSQMKYQEAFESLFDKASREYPFTQEKNIDWAALKAEFLPRVQGAKNSLDFYRALRDFTWRIPDGHVGLSFNAEVFFREYGGGLGMLLAELSDQRIIVTKTLPDKPAAQAGIQPGAELITWNGKPVRQALDAATPYFGPYSTEHSRRLGQVNFLTRMPTDTHVTIEYKNPGSSTSQETTLQAVTEYDSLFETLPSYTLDKLALPIEAHILEDSNLGYLSINTFSDDYHLMAGIWDRHIQSLIDEKIPGLIIDLRSNSGGSMGMALNFAGYFFNQEIELYRSSYYSEQSGAFEFRDEPAKIRPAPFYYDGSIAILVSPECVSACEGFAYALHQKNRSIIIGHFPTSGAFGEVGRGQYKLPGDLSVQFPTGRSETMDSQLLIENTGVLPDIIVPVTADSALGKVDALLQAAIQTLLEKID